MNDNYAECIRHIDILTLMVSLGVGANNNPYSNQAMNKYRPVRIYDAKAYNRKGIISLASLC